MQRCSPAAFSSSTCVPSVRGRPSDPAWGHGAAHRLRDCNKDVAKAGLGGSRAPGARLSPRFARCGSRAIALLACASSAYASACVGCKLSAKAIAEEVDVSEAHDCDLAIVGAGVSGLAAARAAGRAGLSVLVVEARDRVGGRVLNHQIGDGKIVELGGQWIGPTQLAVNELVDELGLERFPTYNDGFNQFEFRGRLSRYKGAVPKINPLVLADIAQAQARLDRMARQVPLDAPWNAPRAGRWDEETAAVWLRRKTHTAGARAFFRLLCEAVWAAHPADLSLLHFLFYAHSAGGFDQLISTDGGAQQHRIVGGSQLIAERMAEELGDRIVLGAPVRAIRDDGESVLVRADDLEIHARRVIVALAPTLAGR